MNARVYEDTLRILAKDQGWSRHKLKSIRGQLLATDPEHREEFVQRLIRKGAKR